MKGNDHLSSFMFCISKEKQMFSFPWQVNLSALSYQLPAVLSKGIALESAGELVPSKRFKPDFWFSRPDCRLSKII